MVIFVNKGSGKLIDFSMSPVLGGLGVSEEDPDLDVISFKNKYTLLLYFPLPFNREHGL